MRITDLLPLFRRRDAYSSGSSAECRERAPLYIRLLVRRAGLCLVLFISIPVACALVSGGQPICRLLARYLSSGVPQVVAPKLHLADPLAGWRVRATDSAVALDSLDLAYHEASEWWSSAARRCKLAAIALPHPPT